jgi:hypothetical protein
MQGKMDPVIFGVNACDNGSDAILDGAHRYVAYALDCAASGLQGVQMPFPAYFLQPPQWRKFLIPNFIAKALRFDDNYVSDAHKWPTAA